MTLARCAVDLTGQTFGALTAVAPTRRSAHGEIIWRFRCACGGELERRGASVSHPRSGTPSCGCLTRGPANLFTVDITGARYGKLTVIRMEDRTERNGLRWRCACDCGNFTIARAKDLRVGTTTSCGCARARPGKALWAHGWREPTIAAGDRFGLLTVQGVASKEPKLGRHYLCRCDCGGQTIVRSGLLRSGQTKSCGCLRRLAGAKREANRRRELETADNTAAELRATPGFRLRLNAALASGGLVSCEAA